MGIVRLTTGSSATVDPGIDAEQITSTVSFRVDTRFNEYIRKADPVQRQLLRTLRNEVLADITWLAQRCSGIPVPLARRFEGNGNGNGSAD